MNGKALYEAVGLLDDDLILEANVRKVTKRKLWIRFAAVAAACFCLAVGLYTRFSGDSLVWNEGMAGISVKLAVPADCEPTALTDEKLAEYYQMAVLPAVLGDGLKRTDIGAQLYVDKEGRVSFTAPVMPDAKPSYVQDVRVTLTEDTSIPGLSMLGAQWEKNGTTIQLSSEGLRQDEFMDIVKN